MDQLFQGSDGLDARYAEGDQLAPLTQSIQDHQDILSGLSEMFSEVLPEEALNISTDLDMTGAEVRWSEFAANPGVITTQAVIESYNDEQTAKQLQLIVDALIRKYTEVPDGADKSQLTPTGLTAYVSIHAKNTTGADVSGITPENIVGLCMMYIALG